jgi:NADPH:quinone reductase-like Zn-dependent oxidoreductase
VREGQRVFVQAGAGGVGTFAIQIARHFGAEVATTCSPRNEALVRSLGATRVIDHTQERFDDVLRDYDLALESLGGEAAWRALKIMRAGGRIGLINAHVPEYVAAHGPWLGMLRVGAEMVALRTRAAVFYGVRLKPLLRPTDGAMLAELAAVVEAGAVRPVIDRVFPLEALAEAHRVAEKGRTRGKIVIAVRDRVPAQASA